MKILWKGGYDSEVEDFMRFEPRRKLLSDSDSKFSLFAIMTKPAGRQRVSLVEGDVHSCGAANIGGAGSRQGERDGRTRRRARRVSPLIAHRKHFVYPMRETQTSSPCSLGGQRSGQVKIMRLMRTIGLQTFSCIANICGSGVRKLY